MVRVFRSSIIVFALAVSALWPAWAADNLDIAIAAREQIGQTLVYDSGYEQIAYPMGDVPMLRGVCTDVVIRALRAVGADLQQLVHEDMKAGFANYPRNWGLTKPDANIDHRRVPNLMAYFERQGKKLRVSGDAKDYAPGDFVTWRLESGRPHIGVVSDRTDALSGNPRIIHNIGWGAREEDVLFDNRITGHYRWF